jgi:hypothetical protein
LFYLFIIIFSFIYLTVPAQDKPSFIGEKQSVVSTQVMPGGPQPPMINQNSNTAEIDRLSSQLDLARRNGDAELAYQLQSQIGYLNGDKILVSPNLNGPPVFAQTINKPVEQKDNIYVTQLPSFGNWSVATSTELNSGRIWVVTAPYNPAGSDTCKFFASDNGGRNWFLVNQFFFGSSGAHFTINSFQAEALNDGTNGWIYAVGSISFNNITYSFVTRFKGDGSNFYFSYLYTSTSSVREYWPRMTSDNWKYSTLPYICIINTQDSMIAANNHTLCSKLTIVLSPYAATPTIAYRNTEGIAGFSWFTLGASDSTYLYNDIAWYDSAGSANVLIAVSNFYNLSSTANNVYVSQVDNYGTSSPRTLFISETNKYLYPSIAFTGEGGGNGIIVYRRFFSGGDWDAAYQRTTNFGSTWTMGFIDYTTDTTFFVDAKAVKGSNGNIKVAWTNVKNGLGQAKYESFSNTSRGDTVVMNAVNLSASTSFGIERAGYNMTSDDCFSAWCTTGGQSVFVTAGCTGTTTGIINNNTIPFAYKLNQNYPNPFNPTTRINYAIPKEGLVTLKIYDITGREITTLVNEVKSPGNYAVDFNAINLSSGVYFYKLISGSFSDVKKLILVK